MLEISHQQAQYLIRQASDRRLPEQQWNTLQAHLEQCAACHAYRDRLALLERNLRRSLHDRWQPISGPAAGLAKVVVSTRQIRRERRRKLPTYAGLSVLLVLLLVLGGRPLLRAFSPAAAPTQAVVLLPTLTPTPSERFRGVVAFTASQEGNSEIYLLTASGVGAPDVTNLTQSPADETGPVWSADGAWIAFLSNRTGKNEVYIMSVAGSRLTQLTSAPDVDWQAPLAWSPDGRWLALIGRRRSLNNEPWVYLLPLNNADPRSSDPRVLPGTQGVTGPLQFYRGEASKPPAQPTSPAHPDASGAQVRPLYSSFEGLSQLYLAYVSPQYGGTLVRYDLEAGRAIPLTLDDSRSLGLNIGVDNSFDLQQNGYLEEGLYIAQGRDGSGLEGLHIRRLTLDQTNDHKIYDTLISLPAGDLIRDPLRVPTDQRIAYLQQTDGSGCWRLALHQDTPGSTDARVFDQFCVQGQLRAAQWQRTGRWAVLLASAPGDAAPALYALRMPGSGDVNGPLITERLTNVNQAGEGISIRPEGADLKLQPRAVQASEERPAPAVPPNYLPGKLLLVAPDPSTEGTTSAIRAADPGSPGYYVLVPDDANNRCPSASPDGNWVAFVSDRADRVAHGNKITLDPKTGKVLPRAENLFVVSIQGNHMLQLNSPYTSNSASAAPIYGCPVWSPDGKYVASVLRTPQGRGLTVNTLDGDLVRYVPIGQISLLANLAWTPDGRSILAAQPSSNGRSPSIVSFDWRSPTAGITLFTLSGWDDVQGLSVSPDGQQLALILVRQRTPDRAAQASLRVYDLNPFQMAYQRDLPAYDPTALKNPGRLFWLQDGGLAFAIPSAPLARYKAMLVRYMPQEDLIQFLAYIDDTLNDWALNGAWLVYSSESGLWGLPFTGRFDQRSAPIRLNQDAASSLSWR